jgi:hypothetical protein
MLAYQFKCLPLKMWAFQIISSFLQLLNRNNLNGFIFNKLYYAYEMIEIDH